MTDAAQLPMHSEQLDKIVVALSAAQGKFGHAIRDGEGLAGKTGAMRPYGYATLASVLDTCRPALAEHGLSYIQITHGALTPMLLETRILHSSGQWLASYYPILPVQNTPQAYGSALTYARRYSLSALLGIAPGDEDDGAQASAPAVDPAAIAAAAVAEERRQVAARQRENDKNHRAEVHKIRQALKQCQSYEEVKLVREAASRVGVNVREELSKELGAAGERAQQTFNSCLVTCTPMQWTSVSESFSKLPTWAQDRHREKFEQVQARLEQQASTKDDDACQDSLPHDEMNPPPDDGAF